MRTDAARQRTLERRRCTVPLMANAHVAARGQTMSKPDTGRQPAPYEKFVALARKVVRTPKAEVDKRERAWRKRRRKGPEG
jgi:uncharacterized protein YifE (UPF0438 family)